MMELSLISDIFGILGGLVLLYSGGKAFRASYRYGMIAKFRWNISRKLLPFSPEDIDEFDKHQKTRYLIKLRTGDEAEINTALDYVNFLNWDSDFDDAVSHIVCNLKHGEAVRIKACKLLTQKLSVSQNGM